MKKLFLTIITCFACAWSLMAQHTDILYQSGNSNISTVTQDTYFEDPITIDYPSPVGNYASVDQIGNANLSNVVQDNNGYGGGTQTAYVDQIGNSNEAGVSQINFGHLGIIYSEGNYNDAFITQDGNLNDGYITQYGNYNYGLIRTNGAVNYSLIFQQGDQNEAWQYMGGVGDGTEVNQNEFWAYQYGISNWAYQEIQGDDFAGGVEEVRNDALIVQTGVENTATQLIYFGFGDMHDNVLTTSQTGDYNTSGQYVRGSFNNTTHTSIGNYNTATTFMNW